MVTDGNPWARASSVDKGKPHFLHFLTTPSSSWTTTWQSLRGSRIHWSSRSLKTTRWKTRASLTKGYFQIRCLTKLRSNTMPKAATFQTEAHEDRAAWRSTWKQSAKTFILVIASWSTPRTTSRAITRVCIKSGKSLTASTTSSLSKICTQILKRRERSHSMIPLASKTAGIYS